MRKTINKDKDAVPREFPAAPVLSTEIAVVAGNEAGSDVAVDRAVESKDVLAVAAGIVVAIGYLVTAPISVGTTVVMLLAIGTLFLPHLFPVEDSLGELSRNLTALIYAEIDQAQLDAAIALANAVLLGKNKICDNVTNDFKIWESATDPVEKSRKAERLRAHYIDLTRDYEAEMMKGFLRDDFRGVLVPQYVLAGMRYLAIMVTYYHYADELNLPVRGSYINVKEMVLVELRRAMLSFTDTAIVSYRNGQQKILNPPAGRTRTWDDYNDYRNKVTLSGLDLLPQYRYLDPELYPHGCDDKTLTRRLLTFIDTHSTPSTGRNERTKIAAIEDEYYLLRPVMAMTWIRLHSAYAFSFASVKVLDGLYASQCELITLDGYDVPYAQEATGEQAPKDGMYVMQDVAIGINCYEINGRHWKSGTQVLSPGLAPPPRTIMATIAKMEFLFGESNNNIRREVFEYRGLWNLAGNDFSTFQHNIPSTTDGVAALPSHFSDRLVEFKIFPYQDRHCYLLSWRPKTALEDLLPRAKHVANPADNKTVQLHAIRAVSLNPGRLTIIKGPGFCGGDLVNVQGGASFSFRLTTNQQRWFSGFYFVRLWFVNRGTSLQLANVSVRIEPYGNFASSEVTTSIPGVSVRPDVNNLKYADLEPVIFGHTVLISAAMHVVTITFRNTSLATEILIDRIELIFDRAASFSEGAI